MPSSKTSRFFLLGVALSLVLVLLAWLGRALCTPTFTYQNQLLAPLAAQLPWQSARMVVDGVGAVPGLVRQSSSTSPYWLLFFGGNAAEVLLESQNALDAWLKDTPLNAAVFSYPGFTGAAGSPSPATICSTALAAWRYLERQHGAKAQHTFLIGFSLGSFASLCVADESAAEFASLILLAPLERIHIVADDTPRWQRAALADSYDNRRRAKRYTGRWLLVHGKSDRALPWQGAQRLSERLGPGGRLVLMNELGHVELQGSEDVRAVLLEHIFLASGGFEMSTTEIEGALRREF